MIIELVKAVRFLKTANASIYVYIYIYIYSTSIHTYIYIYIYIYMYMAVREGDRLFGIIKYYILSNSYKGILNY